MKDNNQEIFPLVDEAGNVTGSATRGFVAQLGRKFRPFSLTMQRYEKFKGLPNLIAKKARKKARTRVNACSHYKLQITVKK